MARIPSMHRQQIRPHIALQEKTLWSVLPRPKGRATEIHIGATKRERSRRKLEGEKSSREKQLELRDHTATDRSARGNAERGRARESKTKGSYNKSKTR